MKWIRPNETYIETFKEALVEFEKEGRNEMFGTATMKEYMKKCRKDTVGDVEEGRVPATMFWLMDDERLVGRVHIRHRLNDRLRHVGGHIGYAIRPSERKKGYGSMAMEKGIAFAKKLGLEKVMITANVTNEASNRIIKKFGGVLDGTGEKDGETFNRYWIDIS